MKATTMTTSDEKFDVLLELISRSKNQRDAIKHVIMFARNDKQRIRRRTLDEYADLIEGIVCAGPKD